MKFDEKRIAQLMKSLDLTREEAIEMLMDDDDIDHDKPKEFDLSEEQLKNAKKYTKTTTSEKVKKTQKERVRKEHPTKQKLINTLADALAEFDPIISNKERQIDFSVGAEDYSITLTLHRKKK